MIQILFFARLREVLGVSQIEMPASKSVSVLDLRTAIIQQYPAWEIALTQKNILIAVNKQFSNLNSVVNPQDEVAFFPPVTGG